MKGSFINKVIANRRQDGWDGNISEEGWNGSPKQEGWDGNDISNEGWGYVSFESLYNDLETLYNTKTALESHESLSPEQLSVVGSIISGIYERNDISAPSVESTDGLVYSVEGAMSEIWRRVKNGTISAVNGISSFFERLELLFGGAVSAIASGLAKLGNYAFNGPTVGNWVQLIGAYNFWACYKFNEQQFTAFSIHEKPALEAVQQLKNTSEFFKLHQEYVTVFHDGIVNILKRLHGNESVVSKASDLIADYNEKTNRRLIAIANKMFPRQHGKLKISPTLLGGKYIATGDLRNGNTTMLSDEAINIANARGDIRTELDTGTAKRRKVVKMNASDTKKVLLEARKCCESVDAMTKKVMSMLKEATALFDEVDKASYEANLSDMEKNHIRNFVRDTGRMISNLDRGAFNFYLEAFAQTLPLFESLTREYREE